LVLVVVILAAAADDDEELAYALCNIGHRLHLPAVPETCYPHFFLQISFRSVLWWLSSVALQCQDGEEDIIREAGRLMCAC